MPYISFPWKRGTECYLTVTCASFSFRGYMAILLNALVIIKENKKKEEAFFGKDLQFLRIAFFEPNSYKHFQNDNINL